MVEEITARVLDTMIRQRGWHFMWIQGSCSRRGFGLTQIEATQRALERALKGLSRRYNAAELESVRSRKLLGVYIVKVTLQPRQIQQHTSLDLVEGRHPQAVSAR
jgi:hypothetical protein